MIKAGVALLKRGAEGQEQSQNPHPLMNKNQMMRRLPCFRKEALELTLDVALPALLILCFHGLSVPV